MSDSDNYRPIKRIRQACENCRRKKARCTGERPECAFCVRLNQACSYADDDAPAPSQNGNEVVRNGNGNGGTRDLGDRLTAIETQMSEVVRAVKGLATTVQTLSKNITPSASTQTDATTNNEDAYVGAPYSRLPPMRIIRSAAHLYFRFCHNQPYSLFHEESLRNKIELDEVPAHLLFALLASTVRYSQDSFFEDKVAAVSAYASQSWKSIVMPWNGIQSEAELSIVQTILLLAIVDYTDGRTQASWIKVGLAIRLAQDFRLMVEPDKAIPPIQQEERRRVFWSFYLADKLISCGRERPAVILDDQCKLQLPGDENEWRAGNYQQIPTLEDLNDDHATTILHTLSPFAIATVMASLLGRCAQYALGEQEEQVPGGKTLPWNPRSKYFSIHSSLLQVESELGLNESLSTKIAQLYVNADGSVDQHRAAPLVLSHALYFLCQCLLYHPFLLRQRLGRLGQRTPQSFLAQTFHSCQSAATALSRLMDDVKSLGCETLTPFYDPFYGYCTMVAGTIHSMFLQVKDPLVVETATTSFESSLQNLQELSFYWKSCGMMRSRLEDFRENNGRYTSLVDPSIQEVHLTSSDANDLIECLDYSRMSTTPRRKSQSSSTAHLATLSQLPSPFFEEFVNLLPLSYSRPISIMPSDDIFAQPPPIFTHGSVFDNSLSGGNGTELYPSTSLPSFSTLIANGTMPPATANAPAHASSDNSAFSPTSSYSYGISPGRRDSLSYHQNGAADGSDAFSLVSQQQAGQNNSALSNTGARRVTSPSSTMKRPWYETS